MVNFFRNGKTRFFSLFSYDFIVICMYESYIYKTPSIKTTNRRSFQRLFHIQIGPLSRILENKNSRTPTNRFLTRVFRMVQIENDQNNQNIKLNHRFILSILNFDIFIYFQEETTTKKHFRRQLGSSEWKSKTGFLALVKQKSLIIIKI